MIVERNLMATLAKRCDGLVWKRQDGRTLFFHTLAKVSKHGKHARVNLHSSMMNYLA